MRVRNSDLAKFGAKAERNTDLWQFGQRRPLPYDKATEEKIAFHSKGLKKKYRGDVIIRLKQTDNTYRISSANSNLSKAMSARKPTKPQLLITQGSKNSATPNSSAASFVSTPSTSTEKRKRRDLDYYGFQSSIRSVTDLESAPVSKRSNLEELSSLI